MLDFDRLRALGLTASAIHKRAAVGALYRLYKRVYSIVPPELLSRRGRYMAAVLACGPGAVLSHRSAADLHGLRATDRHNIDVTVPGRTAKRHTGIDVHRATTLTNKDVTIVDGIPVTTVARTMLDLAEVERRRVVERALEQAAILEVLEEAFLAVCRSAGLPGPERQVYVDPGDGEPMVRLDFAWRAQRLGIETDGAKFHSTRRRFEADRRKDQRLMLIGWRVVRFTWRQIKFEPQRVAAVVRRLLSG